MRSMGLARLRKDAAGASTVEHALILAIMGTFVMIAALLLSGRVAEATNEAGTCLSSNGTQCSPNE